MKRMIVKRKKKVRGFTLIELLAVILILGIIALIAIPTVNSVITEARIGAGKRSLDGHIKEIEQGLMRNELNGSDVLNGYYSYADLNIEDGKTSSKVVCESYYIKDNEVQEVYNCTISSNVFCYSKDAGSDLCTNVNGTDTLVSAKVNAIRNTPNTDTSGRTGKFYYVSNDGSDSNDGLSVSKPIKSLERLNYMFNNGVINAGDTVLFRDGDMFRGFFDIPVSDILLGSYGDISKGKPILNRSTADGAKTGVWTEVKKNIWKYEIDGNNPFNNNVGVIWFTCNSGNKNCSQSMDFIDKSFEFSQLVTTDVTYDESNMDEKISSLLTKDLQHYHVGHSASSKGGAGALYLYSTSNPSKRFDGIEFALGTNIIHLTKSTDLVVDNLKLIYGGSHGVGTGTVANLKVTNSEFGFIGGAVQNYTNVYATRYGNAIEIYGSVQDSYGYNVKEGFVVDNCYVYQSYDAGLTFQYTTSNATKMMRTVFSNNVVEYSNYNIEYWNYTESTDQNVINDSYIKYFAIKDNIFRYSGYGICTTRPNGGYSAHIKTWSHPTGFNILNGEFVIENNIFDKSAEMFVYLRTNAKKDLPVLRNNKFIDDKGTPFGYYSTSSADPSINFIPSLLTDYFESNVFISPVSISSSKSDSGKSGDVDWSFNSNTNTLTISGNGKMADYSLDKLPPYSKYKDNIYKIVIGEGITYLGKYAFYDFKLLTDIRIDAIRLGDLANLASNVNTGDNYTFSNAGSGWRGISLVFGPNVTYIPKMLLQPGVTKEAPYITSVKFEGNKIEQVNAYGLNNLSVESLVLPEGITKITGLAIGNSKKLRVAVMPNSLTTISGWTFGADSVLEKVVFGTGSLSFGEAVFHGTTLLSDVIIPNFNKFTGSKFDKFFNPNSKKIINMYGNSGISDLVDSHNAAIENPKALYKSLDSYVINITSNDSISDTKHYGESFSFNTTRSFKVYEYYVSSNGEKNIIDEIIPVKTGDLYTINNLRIDTYIEFK